jgi:ariadne-1
MRVYFGYRVLSSENEIVDCMRQCVEKVNQVLELEPSTTRLLLSHLKWDVDRLMEKFYDGNLDQLFNEACIINPAKNQFKKVVNLLSFLLEKKI